MSETEQPTVEQAAPITIQDHIELLDSAKPSAFQVFDTNTSSAQVIHAAVLELARLEEKLQMMMQSSQSPDAIIRLHQRAAIRTLEAAVLRARNRFEALCAQATPEVIELALSVGG